MRQTFVAEVGAHILTEERGVTAQWWSQTGKHEEQITFTGPLQTAQEPELARAHRPVHTFNRDDPCRACTMRGFRR